MEGCELLLPFIGQKSLKRTQRVRSAGIIPRADADRDTDHIFYEGYYLNNIFHDRQFSFSEISDP